jgi:hypothetical protein
VTGWHAGHGGADRQVLAAALDASVARIGRERFGELIEP